MDHRIFKMLWNWVQHRHQRKRGARWLKYRYWQPVGGKEWHFHFQGASLIDPYSLTTQWWKRPALRLHTSPFDPLAQNYWERRSTQLKWINP
ncbi:MAG: hypothetical protein ACTSUK_01080 [Promethearchaeota archaeon]